MSGTSRPDPGGRPPSPLSYVGLGAELVAPVLLGAFVGAFLDGRFGVEPWLTVVGSILGMVSGMASFLRRVLPRKDGPQDGT